MKVLLDEDVPVQVLEALRQVLGGHEVHHVDGIKWKSKKDLALLPDAAGRGYRAFVTNDKNQLHDVDESKAIRDSGMHHIRYDQDTTRGVEGLALAMASLLAAAVPCLRNLDDAPAQRLVHVRSVAPHQRAPRYEIVDPVTDPPVYWPRHGAAPRRPRR